MLIYKGNVLESYFALAVIAKHSIYAFRLWEVVDLRLGPPPEKI